MDLKEYQQLALRTESKIEKLSLNKEYVKTLLEVFIAQTEILDGLKKEVFYRKAEKANKITPKLLVEIKDKVALLQNLFYTNKDMHDNDVDVNTRLFHGIIGIMTEAGELTSILLKTFNGGTIDNVNIQEEYSDMAWYTAILNDEFKLDWSKGLQNNIDKLRARYPEKYTDEAANNRDLDAERKELEK